MEDVAEARAVGEQRDHRDLDGNADEGAAGSIGVRPCPASGESSATRAPRRPVPWPSCRDAPDEEGNELADVGTGVLPDEPVSVPPLPIAMPMSACLSAGGVVDVTWTGRG